MTEQYVAKDRETGFEVTVTGDFPPHPDDRMRIARTTTLFTKLVASLLQRGESQRRLGFRAIESQLEIADALIRQDQSEVQRLVRETLTSMGVSEDYLREMAQRLAEASGLDPRAAQELSRAFGLDIPPADSEDENLPEVLDASVSESDGDDDQLNLQTLQQLDDLLAQAQRLLDNTTPPQGEEAGESDGDDGEGPARSADASDEPEAEDERNGSAS